MSKGPPAILEGKRPCAFALGAIGVPARRWNTRADLYQRLDEAKGYLEQAPLDSASLEAAAREVGISAYHFARLFREVHGVTPHQFLISRRIEAARRLLACGMPVCEVAVAVGYESQSAFGRVFRQHTGLAPSSFARSRHGHAEAWPSRADMPS